MAANYGWALSFLKSHGDLWKLFQKAVKNNYTTARFVAELRNTKWFKTNSDTYRQMQVLKSTDPKTYSQRLAQMESKLRDTAGGMGATLSAKQLAQVATNAMDFGWGDSDIQNALGNYVQQMGGGHFGGEAGKSEEELRQYAMSQGIRVSDSTITNWVRNIAVNNSTVENYKAYVQTQAQNTFAPFADQIKQGQTVADLAQPYIQQMGQTLELDPAALNIFDPTIRKAMTSVGPDGKPAMTPLWQFETNLKKDPRWLQTDNAKSSLLSAGTQVLKDFGFEG